MPLKDYLDWYIRGTDQTKGAIASAKQGIRDYERQLDGLKGTLGTFGKITFGVISFEALKGVSTAIVDTQLNLDRLRNTLGQGVGFANVATEMAYLTATSKTLGLDLGAVGDSYAKLTAATRGTALQGEDTRKIFEAVSKASTAFGMSAEETTGALRALQQIVSKGKVQAEELTHQLGDRLPGALQIYARALGVTTGELTKMMERGEVGIETLRLFADQLGRETAEAAERGATSMQAAINLMSTSWLQLKQTITEGGAGDLTKAGIGYLTEQLNQLAAVIKGIDSSRPLGSLIDSMAEVTRQVQIAGAATKAISGTIGGRAFDSTAEEFRAAADNMSQRKQITDAALAKLDKIGGKFAPVDTKFAEWVKEMREVGNTAPEVRSKVEALIAAATAGRQKKGGKSAIQKIEDELKSLEETNRRLIVGERESFLTRISKEGATGDQLIRAKAKYDERDAFEALIAAAQKNNEETEKAIELSEQWIDKSYAAIKGIKDEASEQEFLASMLGKTNAERQVELKLRQMLADKSIDEAQVPQAREMINKGQRAAKLTSLVDAGEGQKLRETQEDMRLLTDEYQKFLDTGGKEGITQTQYLDAVTERLDLVAEKTQKVDQYSQQLVQTFSSGFEEMLFAGGSVSDMFDELLIDVAKLILRAQILGPLFQSIFNASGGGGVSGGKFDTKGTIFGAVMGLFTGGAGGAVAGAVSAAGRSAAAPSLPNYDTSLDESWGAGGGMVKSAGGGASVSINNSMTIGANADRNMISSAVDAATARSQAQILASMNRGGDFA